MQIPISDTSTMRRVEALASEVFEMPLHKLRKNEVIFVVVHDCIYVRFFDELCVCLRFFDEDSNSDTAPEIGTLPYPPKPLVCQAKW